MDEKIREIEKSLIWMKFLDPNSLLQSEKTHIRQVEILLSRIKELELELHRSIDRVKDLESLVPWIGDLAQVKARVKELEKGIETIINYHYEYSGYINYLDIKEKLKKLVEKE